MQRTTIVLPERLKRAAVARARAQGLSFGEFVRRALEGALDGRSAVAGREKDPFLSDTTVYRGRVPADLSERHDHYLYGDD